MCAYGYDLLRRTITLSHCSCFSVCYVWFTSQQIAPFTMGLKAHTRHTHTHTHTHTHRHTHTHVALWQHSASIRAPVLCHSSKTPPWVHTHTHTLSPTHTHTPPSPP